MPFDLHDLDLIDSRAFPYVAAMRACIQDPVYHGEGDVWTHTKMVFEALQRDDRGLKLTALYHDVCKPKTRTVVYDPLRRRDVVGHPNHARLGAQVAWHDLWLADEPLDVRLWVWALCLWHQKVFHLWKQSDMQRTALAFAALGHWPDLLAFAQADNAGRICPEQAQTHDNLLLMQDYLDETFGHSLSNFWQNPYDRKFYFEKDSRSPYYSAQKPAGSRVIILSGLPGAGKDRHCATLLEGLATVSLDNVRKRLKVAWTEDQGTVRQAALEEARVHLRARTPFVYNAQNITRLTRGKIIDLCRAYDAEVIIHAFDRPLATLLRQNRQRDQQVPESTIRQQARKWEPPTLLEAHEVIWV